MSGAASGQKPSPVLPQGQTFPPSGTTATFGTKTKAYKLPKDTSWNYVNGASARSVSAATGSKTHFCEWEFQASGYWKLLSASCSCPEPGYSSTPMPVGMRVLIECP